MTFGAALLALATVIPVACMVDTSEPPTGVVEQRVVTPHLPSNLNLILNATNGVIINDLAGITGDVGSPSTVTFDVSSTQSLSSNLLANAVDVQVGASVGNVFANDITLDGTDASQSLGFDPSSLPPVPAATTAVPGASNVTVGANGSKQICAGQYASVSLGANATLNLNGGVYHMSTLSLAQGAKLEPSEPVVILVSNNVNIGTGAVIGPFPVLVNPMSAGDIRIEVGGNITLGASSKVTAHLLAPSGKITTGKSSTLIGAGWANNISVGVSGVVQGQGTFASTTPSVPPACNDNNDCTVDQCVGGGTSSGFCHSSPVADGTTCQSDGVCQAGVCLVPSVTFTASFVSGQDSTPQCQLWNTFRSQLTASSYSSVTITGTFDSVGATCNDPVAATQICQALHTSAGVGVSVDLSVPCNGRIWNVGACSSGVPSVELSADGSTCLCDVGDVLRPCIGAGNPNWGGVNTSTCFAPSQTMTVVCE